MLFPRTITGSPDEHAISGKVFLYPSSLGRPAAERVGGIFIQNPSRHQSDTTSAALYSMHVTYGATQGGSYSRPQINAWESVDETRRIQDLILGLG